MGIENVSKINYPYNPYVNPGSTGANAYVAQPVKQQAVNPYDNMGLTDKMAYLLEVNNRYQATGQINPFAYPPVEAVSATQGAQYGYTPTGTGELSPVLEGREDEIEDCPWKEYYA